MFNEKKNYEVIDISISRINQRNLKFIYQINVNWSIIMGKIPL